MALLRWTRAYDRVFGPKDEEIVRSVGPRTIALRSANDVRAFLLNW
jgi:hypothetical protein